jgi:DNA-directed RNA polymerase subunit RPC12/RpoP
VTALPAAAHASAPAPLEDDRAIACPECGSTLRLKPELAGKQVRCLRCRTVFRIPSL